MASLIGSPITVIPVVVAAAEYQCFQNSSQDVSPTARLAAGSLTYLTVSGAAFAGTIYAFREDPYTWTQSLIMLGGGAVGLFVMTPAASASAILIAPESPTAKA